MYISPRVAKFAAPTGCRAVATTLDVLSWKFPPQPPFNVGDTNAINAHEFLPQH